MKHVIIGTAGHVDHGKTTLIQALTGTNTDRLKEEQERGMTIDLGFASLRLPDGTVAGIVDVPGHERFLKNMLAGVTGVDVALLVIAADESVMPQTREHLDILRILDVRNGVVAITKTDLVDDEWLRAVEDDIQASLAGSFLERSPLIRVSSATGFGIDLLKRTLMSCVSRVAPRNDDLPYRLPVDRSFSLQGFGLVVTGTLAAGTLHVGDTVEAVPQGIRGRVRGLQVHGTRTQEARSGTRVAVNLAGIEGSEIQRGAQLAPPGVLKPTRSIDAVVRLLPGTPRDLCDRQRIRLHLGTAEVLGRVKVLDTRGCIAPGAEGYVQIAIETDTAAARGDRFVIRSYSPVATIGGGIVLDPAPGRHRKSDPAVLSALSARKSGTPSDLVASLLRRYPAGIIRNQIPVLVNLSQEATHAALESLVESGEATILADSRVISTGILTALGVRAEEVVRAYHERFPLRGGMPREEFRGALGKQIDNRSLGAMQLYLSQTVGLIFDAAAVRHSAFQVQLSDRQMGVLSRIEDYYRSCDIATPTIEEVVREVKAPPDAVSALLQVGAERGKFVRVQDGVYYHADTVARLQDLVRGCVNERGVITVGELRDLTRSNRRLALQALEFFDQMRFTRRDGDTRTLA